MIVGTVKRIWWQITAAILFNFPFIGSLHFAWLPVPVLNCYSCPLAQGACPIGTIQHFLVIGAIPLFAIGAIVFFGIIAGRFYCSHLCPFGFLQDLLGRLSRLKVTLPRYFGYGKYAVLIVLVIIIPPLVNEPFFCTLCPAGSLEAGIPVVADAWIKTHIAEADVYGVGSILDMIGWWFWFKIGLLVLVLVAAVIVKRPFCRALCPLGAIFGLFNRISLLVRHPGAVETGHSRYYLKPCPVHISHPEDVDSHHCIKCRECYRPPEQNRSASK